MCALQVEVPQFSGPLDLLLTLIQKRQLDVTDLSLAAVADQYLAQVLALEEELDALSEFLLVASQLLVIKSRALLPTIVESDVEGDPAEELRRRLAEYQILQAAAGWLGQRESGSLRSWPRGGDFPAPTVDAQLAPVAPAVLARLAVARSRGDAETDAPTLDRSPRPTLRERAHAVLTNLAPGEWQPLASLLGTDVVTAVATFLAVLALVRRGLLAVRQRQVYGPAEISRTRDDATLPPEFDLEN